MKSLAPPARSVVLTCFTVCTLLATAAAAEEGMWPYNLAPADEIKKVYGFEVTPAFLDHARLSSVRFNNGGSGSFVSGSGLVMTNQHVGRDCIQKLTTPERDLMVGGFYAATPVAELKCPDLELNQTVDIQDVTAQVEAAGQSLGAAASAADRNKAKKAKMAELEKGCADEGRQIRCDVVTLYSGGAYHLYRYQKYTDVRLVWAPENDTKHFGGEPDNFNFPRMSLDVAFFRVYRADKALDSSQHFFKWSKDGAQRGQLTFVSGHPGSTGRLATPAELAFLRDVAYPFLLDTFTEMQATYAEHMATGPEGRRVALADWLRASNAKKAIGGYLKGLRDPELVAAVKARHEEVKGKLSGLPAAERDRLLEAWPRIEKAYGQHQNQFTSYLVTGRFGPSGRLFSIARHLLRLEAESKKPDGERLPAYRDAGRPSLELNLFSPAPIDDELEIRKLGTGLARMAKVLGANDPVVKAVLAGKAPMERARELVTNTKLKDVEIRRQLAKQGVGQGAAQDPMVAMALALDPKARELQKVFEDGLEAEKREVAGRIAEAWAKAYGQTTYPDATFTLRLSYGTVQGYTDAVDGVVPWRTQVGDLYRKNLRSKNQEPYQLPARVTGAVGKVDFTVPYNFVSTHDIIGGNSGSPMFNTDGELVGLIFDGNIHQLSNRFMYRSTKERAVSVHSAGILHMLERVYEANALAGELKAGAQASGS